MLIFDLLVFWFGLIFKNIANLPTHLRIYQNISILLILLATNKRHNTAYCHVWTLSDIAPYLHFYFTLFWRVVFVSRLYIHCWGQPSDQWKLPKETKFTLLGLANKGKIEAVNLKRLLSSDCYTIYRKAASKLPSNHIVLGIRCLLILFLGQR